MVESLVAIYLTFSIGIDILENQVKEAKQMVEESDIKYDEAARKLAMVSLKNIRSFRGGCKSTSAGYLTTSILDKWVMSRSFLTLKANFRK